MNRTQWKILIGLYFSSLIVLLGVASFQSVPGYMDASYYFSGATQLADGKGFNEFVLWNYLDNPTSLPHPSHAYWQPLTSILGFIGIKLFFFLTPFKAAQLFLILLGAAVAPLTAYLAALLTKEPDIGIMWLAGLFAIFSGFYLPFLSTTDAFSIYMLGGGIFCLLILKQPRWWGLGLGGVAGWMYLARADGLIWLGLAGLAILLIQQRSWRAWLGLFGGFGLLAGPWVIRNFSIWGSWRAPGGQYMLWLLGYDEIFSYPPELISFERWQSAGLTVWGTNIGSSLGQNMQTMFVVQGLLILFPFIIFAMWQLRRLWIVRLTLLGWGLTALVMTVVFPLAGPRGGFFHSGAAFMPMFWAAAALGLRWFAPIIGRLPRWSEVGAWLLLRVFTIITVIFLSGITVVQAIPWGLGQVRYAKVEARLIELGIDQNIPVLVNDAPSYHVVSERPALVIPNGDIDMLLSLANQFDVGYVLLEENHVAGLSNLYDAVADVSGLTYLETFDEVQIYQVGLP